MPTDTLQTEGIRLKQMKANWQAAVDHIDDAQAVMDGPPENEFQSGYHHALRGVLDILTANMPEAK